MAKLSDISTSRKNKNYGKIIRFSISSNNEKSANMLRKLAK